MVSWFRGRGHKSNWWRFWGSTQQCAARGFAQHTKVWRWFWPKTGAMGNQSYGNIQQSAGFGANSAEKRSIRCRLLCAECKWPLRQKDTGFALRQKKGVPLANSVTPHYNMEKADLLSSLNAISQANFTDYAVNGATVTFTIDSALFQTNDGVNNLAAIFKTFLTGGGMQFQPNVIDRKILLEAYENPEKHKYLMVRVAGYCAYFNELSDELKKIIINRVCY